MYLILDFSYTFVTFKEFLKIRNSKGMCNWGELSVRGYGEL